MEVCKESFFMGVKQVREGATTGDIGHAIQTYVESHGYSVIRALVGHGVGRTIHEDPRVPNFGSPKTGATLHDGMTIAIEPMIAAGSFEVYTKPDRWTVAMRDGSISAHYEETVLVTKKGYDILTR
jgi:methionyl aminopeptidase